MHDMLHKKSKGTLGKDKRDAEGLLPADQTTQYRAVIARANFISPDRPDITYAVKELARSMAAPTLKDWEALKRLARYLSGKPRLKIWFAHQAAPESLTVFTDSDWAGCPYSRRSTSGGALLYGAHLLKNWSKTQAIVALSSAEAELCSTVNGSAEGLGVQVAMKDFGRDVGIHLLGDASAALGVIQRHGPR